MVRARSIVLLGPLVLSTALAAIAAGGCSRKDDRAPSEVDDGDPASGSRSGPVPHFDGPSPADSPRARDPRWARAADGDPIELAALADAEGAEGLLDGVDDGGAIGRTALRALSYADDATLALGRLGDLVRRVSPREVDLVLASVLEIALRPPVQREPLDSTGAQRCANALARLAEDSAQSARTRATATSALRLLVDRAIVRSDRISSR